MFIGGDREAGCFGGNWGLDSLSLRYISEVIK